MLFYAIDSFCQRAFPQGHYGTGVVEDWSPGWLVHSRAEEKVAIPGYESPGPAEAEVRDPRNR